MKIHLYLTNHRRTTTALLAVFSLSLLSCAEDAEPDPVTTPISVVYDDNEYSAGFCPIDVVETSDEGFLVLAERKLRDVHWSGIYLLKSDRRGVFQAASSPDEHYVNPIGPLMARDEGYAFLAMDRESQEAVIINVDITGQITETTPIPGITYPAAAGLDGQNILLLSYDHVDRKSVVSRHTFDGTTVGARISFGIGAADQTEEPVMNHFARTGRRFPFQVGKTAGSYYFNGFYNYTFSLVFTDLQSEDPIGVVYGNQDDGGFSAVQPLGGNTFALARFNFGDNYLLPRTDVPSNTLASAGNLGGFTFPEMTPDAPVRILSTAIDNREVVIYATNTRSKQVALYIYDALTGTFLSARYLGFSNPYEVGGVMRTEDGGLVVTATTWLAGRFPRISLFKLPGDELRKLVK